MLDCTKRLVDLTPYEAYQCFLQADIWQQIGKNTRRMWAAFTGTTIGDWEPSSLLSRWFQRNWRATYCRLFLRRRHEAIRRRKARVHI